MINYIGLTIWFAKLCITLYRKVQKQQELALEIINGKSWHIQLEKEQKEREREISSIEELKD